MGKTDTKPTKSKAAAKAKSPAKTSGGGGKKDGKNAEQVIMEVLATFFVKGNKEPLREKVAKATKLAAKTLSNTIPKLKRKNFVECPDGKTIRLTDEGIKFLGPLAQKGGGGATTKEVHENLKKDMTGKQVMLFDLLVDGAVHDRDDIAKKLGYSEGRKTKAFVNLIGAMKSKDIVHYPTKDTIQLVLDTCFPFGLEE